MLPPAPLKLFPEPSTYTPVPVPETVILPVFFPELVPLPAMYIPRLDPAFISPVFSTEAVSPAASVLAAIPDDVPAAPLTSRIPVFIPFPFPVYIPILSVPVIVIFPFEVRIELPPTYEAILFEVVLSIFLVLTRFIPSAAYIPILLVPVSLISALFIILPVPVPLL